MARKHRLDEYFRALGREARSGRADIEALLREAVELAVEEALERTAVEGKRGERSALEECSKRVEELAAEISEVKKAIKSLEAKIEALSRALPQSGAKQPPEPEWVKKLKALVERMGGVAPLSITGVGLDEQKAKIMENYGLVGIKGARDFYVLSIEALIDFFSKLDSIKSSDEEEAANKLGSYSQLFRELRRAGLLIYSSREKKWIPQDELKAVRAKYYEKHG